MSDTNELPSDERSELYVLSVVLAWGDVDLLRSLEPEHFVKHQLMFRELRLMDEAGYPIEPAAIGRWFSSRQCKERGAKEGEDSMPAYVAECGRHAPTIAHKDFHVGILNRERLRRGLMMLATRLSEKNEENTDTPIDTLQWLQEQFDKMWSFAYQAFPEEMAVE